MAYKCKRGSVRIPKRLGLKLLKWHVGMADPVYAVGSSAFAGRCVSENLLRSAAFSLRLTLRDIRQTEGYTTADFREVDWLIDELYKRLG